MKQGRGLYKVWQASQLTEISPLFEDFWDEEEEICTRNKQRVMGYISTNYSKCNDKYHFKQTTTIEQA